MSPVATGLLALGVPLLFKDDAGGLETLGDEPRLGLDVFVVEFCLAPDRR
jgi:hypothetical protein